MDGIESEDRRGDRGREGGLGSRGCGEGDSIGFRGFVGVINSSCYFVGRIAGGVNTVNTRGVPGREGTFSSLTYSCWDLNMAAPIFLGVRNCPMMFLTLLCLHSLWMSMTAQRSFLSFSSSVGYCELTFPLICSLRLLMASALFFLIIGLIFRLPFFQLLFFRVLDLTIEH